MRVTPSALGWLRVVTALAAVTCSTIAASTAVVAQAKPVQVVPGVDFARYAGKWFEIARFPNRFQKQCLGGVTATYTPMPDRRRS